MKKVKALTGLFTTLFALVAVLIVFIVGNDKPSTLTSVSQTVSVNDGVAKSVLSSGEITVSRSGKYSIIANWWPEENPGFLTGIAFFDETGEIVHAIVANKATSETFPIALNKGKLSYKITILTSNAEADEYDRLNNLLGEDSENHAFEGYCDGEWYINYELGIRRINPYVRLIITFLAALAGLDIALILVVATREKVGALLATYDERQIMARGAAYRYGFFTLLAYSVFIALACSDRDIELPIETTVLIMLGVFLSAFVFAAICIVRDAYFAIEDNKKSVIAVLAFVAVVNLFIGVRRLLMDGLFVDGKVGMSVINLLGGIFIVLLLIVVLIKVFFIKEDEEE